MPKTPNRGHGNYDTMGSTADLVDECQPLPVSHHECETEVVVRGVDLWKIFWWFVVIAFIGAIPVGMYIKTFIENGDVEFDSKNPLRGILSDDMGDVAAIVLYVLLFTPLQTTINYQYRYGGTTMEAFRCLNADGGYPRYFEGLFWALVQGPVSRFGDAATNTAITIFLESNIHTNKLPSVIKIGFASLLSTGFRVILSPIDTIKATLQTEGKPGYELLERRIMRYGIISMWFGALGGVAASLVAYYPWLITFNYLQELLPKQDSKGLNVSRQALIGFCAAVVSDTVSNSLRVVQVYRQTHQGNIGYLAAAKTIIDGDGWPGFLSRGLTTRVIANGCQIMAFSVLWKLVLDLV